MMNNSFDFNSLIRAEVQRQVENRISELKPQIIIKEKEVIKENLESQLKLYTVKDLAEMWHLSEATIRKLIAKGYLRAIKFSAQGLKISPMEVARFIKEYEGKDFEKLLKDC